MYFKIELCCSNINRWKYVYVQLEIKEWKNGKLKKV